MKITDWARHAGIHPKTARRWFHQGVLPAPARQLSTGTILVDAPPEAHGAAAALYARVSSWDHRVDLDRQLGHLRKWAARTGLAVVRTEAEVGPEPSAARADRGEGGATAVVEKAAGACIPVSGGDRPR